MRKILLICLIAYSTPLNAQASARDVQDILQIHGELLEAHRARDVDRWMAVESTVYVSANGGRVTFPSVDDRRVQRGEYLESASFEVYCDVREPIVRMSADGSLGWLIAEVQVRGTALSSSGLREAFHEIFAWVELYERVDGDWLLVGNASNRRAPGSESGEQCLG